VDAKLLGDRPSKLKLSGKLLFWLLAIGLVLSASSIDWWRQHQTGIAQSGLALPLMLSAIGTAALGFWVVPLLRRLKAGQVIREDGPQAHLSKAGTPTMGGIFVVPVGVAVALVVSGFAPIVVSAVGITLAYGFIGWLDDWQILRKRSNKGISPRMKLLLQAGFAGAFCLWVGLNQPDTLTTVLLPLGFALPLGLLFWPIAILALVSESNATNLTDGVDGLAGGTGAISLLGLGAIVVPASPELAMFCASLAGSYLGFLMHNRNPARVFMGDTGSLALGGALAGAAILSQSLWALLVLGGVFLAETLSVVAQVSYYKATKGPDGVGKRLFRMAPLHHHLELSGWPETKVVAVLYLVTAGLTLLSLAIAPNLNIG